jgi:hypothetical protein
MSVDGKFTVMKRFNVLHTRNLLYLQDILSEAEERLNACDDTENVDMYLSSRRKDGNVSDRISDPYVDPAIEGQSLDTSRSSYYYSGHAANIDLLCHRRPDGALPRVTRSSRSLNRYVD